MFPKIDAKFFDYKGFNEYRDNITFFQKKYYWERLITV